MDAHSPVAGKQRKVLCELARWSTIRDKQKEKVSLLLFEYTCLG